MDASASPHYNQFLAHKSAASYPKRHLYAGFACGIADRDWEFIDNDYLNQCHVTGAALAYKFASEENPMQLRNDTGGMDDDDEYQDEGVDVIYPYQQDFMNKAAADSASEEEMSDVPECEMSSSREGSIVDDEALDGMHPVDSSFGSFPNGPVVFRQEGGDEVMAMAMEMEIQEGISADCSKKRKRWIDNEEENLPQQQSTQQFNFPTATGLVGAPWGAFPQNSVKRVRVYT